MLETGVQSRILLIQAIEGSTAKDLAIQLGTWLSDVNVIVHDIQISKADNKWVAIVVFRQ